MLSDKRAVGGGIANKFVERNDEHCDGSVGGQMEAGIFTIQKTFSFTLFVNKFSLKY